MASLNKAQIIGFVGKNPETRVMQEGNSVTSFSVATSEKYKDKTGQQKEQVEWHKISCFGKLSEITSMYVKKGSQLYIEGKITTRSWKDAAGVQKWTTEIKADKIEFLNRVAEVLEDDPSIPSVSSSPSASLGDMDDDVPF
jgi:single-strand DNA-binding protein